MRKYQKGHATLLAAIITPALFGVFVLATDGAMALQQKARMDDAHEVAALALSAQDSKSSDKNKKIAKAYITEYMGDSSKIADVRIKRLECEQIPECKAGLPTGGKRYVRYSLSAKYDHSTFFPNSDVAPETLTISSNATSEKFEGDAVDIMYVADFSGSMNSNLKKHGTDRRKKIVILKEIINEVNQKLEKANKSGNKKYQSTVGIVPFASVTKTKISGSNRYCNINQLVRKSDKYSWSRLDEDEIDYTRTFNQIFTEKGRSHCTGKKDWSLNKEVDSTSDFKPFIKIVNKYRAKSGTGSYQGIIRAAQLLRDGENPRRLIIVLSDGKDSNIANYSNKTVHEQLVGMGYCDAIRRELSKGKTADNRKISAKIAVIGFGYDTKDNPALINCAGKDNVYEAHNKQEIKAKILDLITEEIGHLK
ncbi:TadE/TadG family type IV pilus assembly protein [Vibrio nigripulchritudo]|uniref:TadE/TadG family type IV pilus assembly protein n=1 Tax=Vibrio nigripulchritudo TaxID=28173 RepID=UPI0005FA6E50|nr:TadE/TadG family type IV pilus assembly protein [Vibrio nigripulchritudo]KJY74785.1 hypothetical protein TW74_18950 [Vibrio nigripulchritudo]